MKDLAVKERAKRLIEQLPEDATWEDLMERIYVQTAIERGLADSEAGRTMTSEQLRQKLGLSR